ncbi:hypothetical protein PsYK624_133970 [Phanerochaete sordida]|uniref:DUF6535 domain-containing protein n=1 Tax=Phanerochaete sordida TaxID=48140 RepID=A0A9P3GMX4_9APHY|nr:hypothetical protein PsYK624_133970 [Phanerochaete sordida]
MHRSTASPGGGNTRAWLKAPSATRPKDDDMPPLGDLDDEDDEEGRIFSRYQKESSTWLLFSGILALLITLFITTCTPHPLRPRDTTQEITARLQHMHGQLLLAELARHGLNASALPYALAAAGPALAAEPDPESLAARMRDVWGPALCYSALIVSLTGALVCLRIKHGLMDCTLRFFPLAPATPDPPALRAAVARLREYRVSRAETVARTRRIAPVVPPMMYGAAAMFACGVVANLGAAAWLALAR